MKFGIGLRRDHFDDILQTEYDIDFLEIISENFMNFGGRPKDVLRRLRGCYPFVLHGVSLSIGSLDPLDQHYVDALDRLVTWLKPKWFSDHLSWSSHGGITHHDLIPLPFSEEAVCHVTDKIKALQRQMRIPFLLENPSYYVRMPGAEMTEAEFVREVVERADCGLLLDINNVYVNAVNHGYDARAFINAMPADRVLQYHMAGHDSSGDFLVDTHGAPVIEPVHELYVHALRTLGGAWTLLEWNNDIPPLGRVIEECHKLRSMATAMSVEQQLPCAEAEDRTAKRNWLP